MNYFTIRFSSGLLFLAAAGSAAAGRTLDTFARQELTGDYYSEGVNAADFNKDGKMDVVYGPFWFEGPDFTKRHIIYLPVKQPVEAYADHFFAWPYDFTGDGWPDILTAGFPGTPAYVYENPGAKGVDEAWTKHQVFDWVSNESPHFTDLTGDERPELVCTRDGFFGYAAMDPASPLTPWVFHPVSDKIAADRFGHGLGVGDVNGDGRQDILTSEGWLEQPADTTGDPPWLFHKVAFADYGGAEMYAYDVDGDGDNDVITSLRAHDWGLSWYEQLPAANGEIPFKEHLIMGDRPGRNRYGVAFSELHSVALADIDGDGLKDIVTGKTYWSHHKQSPGWNDGAVVTWFRLERSAAGVNWVPQQADGEAGIGRQLIVTDVSGDGLPDILSGGMKGAHVLRHERKAVDEATWQAAQPKKLAARTAEPVTGPPAVLDAATGAVPGVQEGEALAVKVSGGSAAPQDMKGFASGTWSGGQQLFWSGAATGDTLTTELKAAGGETTLEAVFTRAPDFGIVQLSLDGKPLGEALDLYHFSRVTTTGVLTWPTGPLAAGAHQFTLTLTGANPDAVPKKFAGLDWVRLKP